MSQYDEIIDLPHHVSKKHIPMSNVERAAQFAPFAALSGFELEVAETARLTESRAETSEMQLYKLNGTVQSIMENIKNRPLAEIKLFIPDRKKAGGSYEIISGNIRAVDTCQREIIFTDGRRIDMDMICDIELL